MGKPIDQPTNGLPPNIVMPFATIGHRIISKENEKNKLSEKDSIPSLKSFNIYKST